MSKLYESILYCSKVMQPFAFFCTVVIEDDWCYKFQNKSTFRTQSYCDTQYGFILAELVFDFYGGWYLQYLYSYKTIHYIG